MRLPACTALDCEARDQPCPTRVPRVAHLPCTAALDVIVETVANGDKVTLVNFGTFDSKKREAREGRNPQTNKPMHIPGTCWPGPVFGGRREGTAAHACAHVPLRSFDGADV